jgi:hypothetical protein
MTRNILAAALLAGTAMIAVPAQADIVLSELVFRDLGATGFGNAPRLLTLQSNELESGGTRAGLNGATNYFYGGIPTVTATPCTSNGTCGVPGGGTRTGANEGLVYSAAALGWTSGAAVGIGLDTNETGSNHPLTFQTLTMTVYNSSGVALGSFSGNAPVDISVALLDAQQGNGNSVFDLRLDAPQQAQFDTLLAVTGGPANAFIGLAASFGCGAFGPAVCNTNGNWSSTDGAESFLAFVAVPGPLAGAGIPGIISAMGMIGLAWRRRRASAV